VLREDEAWLAVDKPPGLPVVPDRRGDPHACLRRRLEIERREPLWVVHRLDRDTSGVLLLARTPEAHRALSMAFQAGAVEKTYLALARGVPPSSWGVVDTPLHTARKGKMRPARPGEPGARTASTAWRVLGRWERPGGPLCWIEARPRTGRTHQIRVHLRALGLPLAGDPVYGRPAPDLPLTRTPLHAAILAFPDPTTGVRITVEAPLPPDLEAVLRFLAVERPDGADGEPLRTLSDLPAGAARRGPG
jgi:RluA family pseudouridine synthase